METTNYSYKDSFTKPSIRVGTITVVAAMIASFLPNIYLYFAYGVAPDFSKFLTAWGNIALAFGAFYLVEPVSYFPIFGVTGTYIGILSGNIAQIRLPAASTAQDVIGVEATSEKGEIVGILAICGSVVTNTAFLTVAVIAGSALMAVLPESVSSALSSFVLPSLFGACFAQMALKNLKIAGFAFVVAVAVRLLQLPAWIMILCCTFGIIAISTVLYKKNLLK